MENKTITIDEVRNVINELRMIVATKPPSIVEYDPQYKLGWMEALTCLEKELTQKNKTNVLLEEKLEKRKNLTETIENYSSEFVNF